MAHEDLMEKLAGKSGKEFVVNLTKAAYDFVVKISAKYGSFDFIKYRIFEDINVREYTGKRNRWDEEEPDHYCIDCVLFVEPGRAALDKKLVYTIGVLLKSSKNDLMCDDKMGHCLGYTDFFFLGVPSGLVADAITKTEGYDCIGVLDVDTGQIWFKPERMNPAETNRLVLLEQIMYTRMFNEDFKNNVSFKLGNVEMMGETEVPNDLLDCTDLTPEEFTVLNNAWKKERKDKEQKRQQKHNAKVEAISKELAVLNEEIPSPIVSILGGLPQGDQRVYHVIRQNDGIQAIAIADMLPALSGVEKPSLATIKRSISSLTAAGLIEREGSRKTGQYVTKM